MKSSARPGGRILVAGGTGRLGKLVVDRLSASGEPVHALSRATTDVRDRAAVGRAMAGARVVISAMHGFASPGASPRTVDLEGNANLIAAAEEHGVEHFILLSVHGARADHPMELMRMKHGAEQRLTASTLAWTILRPTAFVETWLTIACAPLAAKGKTVLFGRAENPINFIAVADVASFVELAVRDPALRGVILELGGPDNLSFAQLVERYTAVTGATGTVRRVPRLAMRIASQLMRPFNPMLAGQIHAGVVMDTTDFTFDAAPLRRAYPQTPLTSVDDAIRAQQAQVEHH